MKYWLLPFFGLCFAAGGDTPATSPVTPPVAPATPAATAAPTSAAPAPDSTPAPKRSANDLDELVSPIALYPDPILAILLPASTSPVDIVMAARQLKAGATLDQIQKQPWDTSLKALAHYPEIVKWLDENLEWTSALGEAVAIQQSDVMAAVQRMRAKAKAVGNLPNTAQQEVSVDSGMIEIEPAQADTVCVPYYDPGMAYSEAPSDVAASGIDYGAPLPAGDWLNYDLDWPTGGIWFSDFGFGFRHHHHEHGHFWAANSGRFFGSAAFAENRGGIPHPAFSSRSPSFHRFGSFAFTGIRPSTPSFTRTTAALIPGSSANIIPRSGIFEGGGTGGGIESRPRGVVGTNFVPQRLVTERPAAGFVPQRTFVNPGRPERIVESRPQVVQQSRPMAVEPQRAVVPERSVSRGVTEAPRGGSATFSGGGGRGGGGGGAIPGNGWR